MWKSIRYKEWIKLRRTALGLFIAGILLEVGIFSTVRHSLILGNANQYWHYIVFQDGIFYSIFKYFPLITGLLIGLAQYLPEITDKRIKLTLHLPVNEEKVILWMIVCGTAITLLIFFLLIALFIAIGSWFFPYEIIRQSLLTMLTWYLSGIAAYNLTALITMEPIWRQRIVYIILSIMTASMFFINDKFCSYVNIIPELLLFVAMSSISVLFSIYRFRKGEM
jgi:hypothetical protein